MTDRFVMSTTGRRGEYVMPPKPHLPKDRPLTDVEREQAIDWLRHDCLKSIRALGCTCRDPKLVMTEQVFGFWKLPAFLSQHEDGCPAADV